MHRPPRTLTALLLLVMVALPARAAMLPDSTTSESWRLDNGLEVRTRHIPGASGIAISLAFRAGSGYEPADLEGLAELLAELEFTSAAGEFPDRSREEMTSLRPMGWDVHTGRSLVRFTEIVNRAQLPGALHQFATRLAGLTLTDASLKTAIAQVRRDAGSRYFGPPADVLYWRSDAIARGADDAKLLRLASLPGLSRLTARDVAARLRSLYQPGNAALALAGDLSGTDVRALVQAVFARLPGGSAMPDTVGSRLSGSRRETEWKALTGSAGVVAAHAPALTDSLHPGFFVGMLVTGAALNKNWGPPQAPLAARFQYSLIDDPELIRFYPPLPSDTSDPEVVAGALYEQFMAIGGQIVSVQILNRVRQSVRWLVGGELPDELIARMRRDPGGLGSVANNAASRALWHGDAFWADYLGRLDRLRMGHSNFYEWLTDPAHQTVVLLVSPKPR